MKKKFAIAFFLVFAVVFIGASCNKKPGIGKKLEPFQLSGELKDGGCCLGITTGAGSDATGEINANTISIDVAAGNTFTGEYVWESKYSEKTLVGDTVTTIIKDHGTFQGKIDPATNQVQGTYNSDYYTGVPTDDGGIVDDTYQSSGSVKGEITQGSVAIYFEVPEIPRLMEGYMVENLQTDADNSGDPLHNSYYYFEK